MKPMFYKLPPEKQAAIIAAVTQEFALHHYDHASINQIIAAAAISKGGLFKYVESKQDLYLSVLEHHLRKLQELQILETDISEPDIFARIIFQARLSINYYRQYPKAYQMLANAFADTHSSVYDKANDLRNRIMLDNQSRLLQGIDWERYRLPREEILDLCQWLNDGFKERLRREKNLEQLVEALERMVDAVQVGVLRTGGSTSDKELT